MFYHSDHNQIYGLHAKKFEKKLIFNQNWKNKS